MLQVHERRTTIALALPAVAWAGAGGQRLRRLGRRWWAAARPTVINVLMVGNPQMVDIQKLTADSFTKDTGIKVNYTVLPENELRDKVTPGVRQPGRPVRRRHRRRLRGADLGDQNDWLARCSDYTRSDPRSTRPTCSSR